MRRVGLALLLVCATAVADPPFEEQAPLIVEKIVEAVRTALGRDSEPARAFVDAIMHRERPFRERGEVLALYNEALGKLQNKEHAFFTETEKIYRDLRVTPAELRASVRALGAKGIGAELTPHQTQFFMRHAAQNASPTALKALALFEKFPWTFEASTKATILNKTLPRLVEPPAGISDRQNFFDIYDSILAHYDGQPDALRTFTRDTRDIYHSEKPTVADIIRSAAAIKLPAAVAGQSVYDDRGTQFQVTKVDSLFPDAPLPPIEFLNEQLGAGLSIHQTGEILKEIQKRGEQALRYKSAYYYSTHGLRTGNLLDISRASTLQHLALQTYGERIRAHKYTPDGKDFVGELVATVKQMREMKVDTSVIRGFLEGGLRVAGRAGDFVALMGHLKEVPGNSADAIADTRFHDFLSYGPTLDELRHVYGGKRVNEAQLRLIKNPEWFLALLKDGLEHHAWSGPRALDAFLKGTLAGFYAASPTPAQRMEMLDHLRTRPIPWAQKLAIVEAHGAAGSSGDLAPLKKELARLAVGQLSIPGETVADAPPESRARRRRDALEIIAHHRVALYGEISDEVLIASIARDGLASRAASPVEGARLFAQLGDDLQHAGAEHILGEAVGGLPISHDGYTLADVLILAGRAPKSDAATEAKRAAAFRHAVAKHVGQGLPDVAQLAVARRRFAPGMTDDEFAVSLLKDLHAEKLIDATRAATLMVPVADRIADKTTALDLLSRFVAESPGLAMVTYLGAARLLAGSTPAHLAESRRMMTKLTDWNHPDLASTLGAVYREGESEPVRLAMLVRDICVAGIAPPAALVTRLHDGPPDLAAAVLLRDALERFASLRKLVPAAKPFLEKVAGHEITLPKNCRTGLWARLWSK